MALTSERGIANAGGVRTRIEEATRRVIELAEAVAANTPATTPGPKIYSLGSKRTFLMGPSQRETLTSLERLWPWPPMVPDNVPASVRLDALRELVFQIAKGDPAERAGLADAGVKRVQAEVGAEIGDYEFLFQLNNVELKGLRSATIGQVRFIRLSKARLRAMRSEKDAALRAARAWNDNEFKLAFANSTHNWGALVGMTFAQVQAKGPYVLAQEIAMTRTQLALHFLKLGASDWDERAGMFVAVEGFNLQRERGIHLGRGPRSRAYQTLILGDGPGLSHHIDAADLRQWRKFGLARFNRLASSDDPGDLGRRITRAIHLIGHALNTPAFTRDEKDEPRVLSNAKQPLKVSGAGPIHWQRQERILKLMMAAEALFNLRSSEAVFSNLRRRWVALVEASTKSLDEGFSAKDDKVRLVDFVRHAYNVRSALAHGGETVVGRELPSALLAFLRSSLFLLLQAWDFGVRTPDEHERFYEARGLGASIKAASAIATKAP